MTFQYALRFESGKRRGEIVSVSSVIGQGGAFTIGRKPGNSLQVVDPSVSGRHAELEITEEGVDLRDLNSTNGTLLGGRKVRVATLAHGDEFTLGKVEFTLVDQARAEGAAGDAPAATVPAMGSPGPSSGASGRAAAAAAPSDVSQTNITPREDSLEITAEDLARSKRSSKLGPILLVGLAAAGGAAWWWLGQRDPSSDSGGRARAAAAPVQAPGGNRLGSGYSFEQSAGWSNAGGEGDVEFQTTSGAARSGRRGIRAEVGPGDVATLESDTVRISGGERTFRAFGHVSGEPGVDVRIGLRFSSPDGALKTIVWSDAPGAPGESAGAEFQEIGVTATAPTGMDSAQVVVRAASTEERPPAADEAEDEGAAPTDVAVADVDDVALVPASGAAWEPLSIDAWTITPMGGDGPVAPTTVAVTSLERIFVSSLRVAPSDGDGDASPLTLERDGERVAITVAAAGTLTLRAEPLLVAGGVATMARTGGYASHGATFERAGTTDLLLGAGANLLRFQLPGDADVTGRAQGDAVILRAAVGAGDVVTLQCGFRDERTRAERLARRAEEERSAGNSGAALRTWNELLNEVPFDQRLVDQAAAVQSEILVEGRKELTALAAEVERARFFGLADLFREKLARARELGSRFRGTDVEASSVALVGTIENELRALDSRDVQDEAVRLEAIRRVLAEQGAAELARKIEEYQAEVAPADGTESVDSPGAQSNPTSSGGQ